MVEGHGQDPGVILVVIKFQDEDARLSLGDTSLV